MSEQTFERLLETATAALMSKQEELHRLYALGDMARWSLDQETATTQFFDASDRMAVEAQILNIGSFSPRHSTWKWAWGNPSVPQALREKALPLKELQTITGFDLFASEEAIALEDESMAWELTALAVQHLGALGCYRAPSTPDGPTVFLAITGLKHASH
ncbi:DUF6882 domain-containing protein [Pseudomonas vanderleydeniana]|uniref:Uncharacterized protein n=1 Tax=Pseudomonas vanderleydeniana TaxID=2745495 RepID=A0A9E6PQ52_9PSED|nr:DUF6882 domain-containing protein [Pseudomonas vanderleydeniana]QXI30725.1 hypothetical protein HU752_012600 [Pseudomonas vanderleydeniana]